MAKTKDFDFEKAYKDFMKSAKENGLTKDIKFNTLMEEFKRIKKICDDLYEKINEKGVCFVETGSMGQESFKSNPLNKDYISAQKNLLATFSAINDLLAKVPQTQDDWL